MKRNRISVLIWFLLLGLSVPCFASDIQIAGMIIDQTISRVGRIFYEDLSSDLEIPDNIVSVVVNERPDPFLGNIISIEVDENVVYEDRIGSRVLGIDEKVQAAKSVVQNVFQQKIDIQKQLERK